MNLIKNSLHPILLAETHLKLQLIQPFSTCNGKNEPPCAKFNTPAADYIIANARDIENKSIYQNNILKSSKDG
jgi:hypothetical protein